VQQVFHISPYLERDNAVLERSSCLSATLSSVAVKHRDTQRIALRRERASGAYGTASYFTATVAFDFVPMRVLPTALFALTTYWMIGLRPGLGRAATFLLLLVLTNLTGAAMNMAIGAPQQVWGRVQGQPWVQDLCTSGQDFG